jgi:hypothetical protein
MKWIKRFLGIERKAMDYSADDFIKAYGYEEQEIRNAGSFNGKHYTEYIEYVKQLKRQQKYDEAIKLLLEIISAVEREARMAEKLNWGAPWFIAPGYYKQLAIIYRKEKRYDKEAEILERYCDQTKAPGARVSELEQRLIKANELRDKQKS